MRIGGNGIQWTRWSRLVYVTTAAAGATATEQNRTEREKKGLNKRASGHDLVTG